MTDSTAEPNPTPPWGEDFNATTAWREISTLRQREKELLKAQPTAAVREALAHYAMLADAGTSDLDRAQTAEATANEQIDRLRTRAGERAVRTAADELGIPETELGHLDVAGYVDDDGEVDTDGIRADLAGLLEDRPVGGVRAPRPNPAQGVAQAGPDPEDQLAEARRRGDWRTVLALENRKLKP
jgi:hypothetical protein